MTDQNKTIIKNIVKYIEEEVLHRNSHPLSGNVIIDKGELRKILKYIEKNEEIFTSKNPFTGAIKSSETFNEFVGKIKNLPLGNFSQTALNHCAEKFDVKLTKSQLNPNYCNSIFTGKTSNVVMSVIKKQYTEYGMHGDVMLDVFNAAITNPRSVFTARKKDYKIVKEAFLNKYSDNMESVKKDHVGTILVYLNKFEDSVIEKELDDLFGDGLPKHVTMSHSIIGGMVPKQKNKTKFYKKGIFFGKEYNFVEDMVRDTVDVLYEASKNGQWVDSVHKPVYNSLVEKMFSRSKTKFYFQERELYDTFFEMFCSTDEKRRMTSNKQIVSFCKKLCREKGDQLTDEDFPSVIVTFYSV